MIFEHSSYTILVVDDIAANVLLLKVMLEQEGYNVLTADGSKEAFQKVYENKPDIILLDVLMPEMDGFEFTEKLKSKPEYQDLPIIFLTALDKPSEIAQGFKVGGFDFVSKPFNKIELLARVKHQVSLIEAQRIILKQTKELQDTIVGRDKLYSVIAHDLRAPMSSMKMILNAVYFNINEASAGKDLVEQLQAANKIVEELFSLLDNLLKWTRTQLKLLQPVLQEYNLVELVKGLVSVFEMVAYSKDVHISFQAPEKAIVRIDIDMIKTAIRNLLSNAIKYSYHEGKIEVIVRLQGDLVAVDIIDHGCGIREENKSKLLNVATHYTTFGTDHEEGSGLGLLLAKEFLSLNNGQLKFVSREGLGTTFTIVLPLYKGTRGGVK
ncbi:MAG: hybrid sensor histidine kinase/response regulator [Massilibacteroides sp.]|nr:hybrid sensor histidine kinase/response regulator [Massilibacteroides sp.]MDD3063535.1 hybrid sensor histidine kinase/response regulator [Massilibacteroides sp.]MDD4115260.1 hybrid sensor histidine kinase/response regulator [Massilibacteroides sp.]MDD4661632.1 hybrid sensor histidine kinase/response regulator [Massilibacteroides sp.]